MEYERQVVVIRIKFNLRRACIFFGVILLIVSVILGFIYIKTHPTVMSYAVSSAETIVQNTANQAVLNILEQEDIRYNDIVCLSRDSEGSVTSLEMNIVETNRLKSSITNEMSRILTESERFSFGIPIGSFLGSELTSGIGPDLKFRMQMTTTAFVDFESVFEDAGINQVLHKVLINIKVKGTLVLTGSKETILVTTSAIAAQTVIVGIVPDSYTEVIESDDSDNASIINDYGAY